MRAYLGDQAETALLCERDPGGWLLTMDLPSGIELSLSDAYDGVGPLALRHYPDRREPQAYPVCYDDVDGVEVQDHDTQRAPDRAGPPGPRDASARAVGHARPGGCRLPPRPVNVCTRDTYPAR